MVIGYFLKSTKLLTLCRDKKSIIPLGWYDAPLTVRLSCTHLCVYFKQRYYTHQQIAWQHVMNVEILLDSSMKTSGRSRISQRRGRQLQKLRPEPIILVNFPHPPNCKKMKKLWPPWIRQWKQQLMTVIFLILQRSRCWLVWYQTTVPYK